MRFAAIVGGEPSIGVFPHIHALLELPQHTTPEEIVEYLASLWKRKLKKKLKQIVVSSVTYEVIKDAKSLPLIAQETKGALSHWVMRS